MQKNKASILCTMSLPQTAIQNLNEENISVDYLSFIHVSSALQPELVQKIKNLSEQTAIVVFTSSHAVKITTGILKNQKPSWRIYCISGVTEKETAAFFGKESIAGTAIDALRLAKKIAGDEIREITFFCGDQRRDELPSHLTLHKILVNEILTYKTQLTPQKIYKKYNGILFFSPSAVDSFFSVNEVDKATMLFAIGNTTANAIKKHSLNKIIISELPNKERLIKSAAEYFQTNPINF